MRRIIIISTVFLIGLVDLHAQQLPLFSLYRDNSFIINPAITGTEDHPIVSTTYRQQWTKVDQAPRTFSLNFNMPFHRNPVGFGAQILSDKTGPTSFTGVSLVYSYHLDFSKINPFKWPLWLRKSIFSFGLSASVFQYGLNTADLTVDQPNDLSIGSIDNSKVMPNVGFGMYYYFENFYVGYSSPQLIPFNLAFDGEDGVSNIKRQIHHFVVMGGKIKAYHEKLTFEPMLWFKQVKGAPYQIDGHLRMRYKKLFWVGAGYRTSNTVIIELGLLIQKHLQISYAYDQAVNNMASYIGSSHEFLVSYHFKARKRW